MCIFARAKIDAGGGGGLKFCGYIGKEWRERRTLVVVPLGGRRAVKKNFSFDGKQISKKDAKNISPADLKFLKSLSISLRQEFSENYPEQIIDFLSSKKIEIDNIGFLKNMSAKEKKELLINIEKN